MLTKNEAKYIQSLFLKKQRDNDRVFLAEGPKLATELLKSDFSIEHIYATHHWMSVNNALDIPVTEVSNTELERISQLSTPNEVLMLVKQPEMSQKLVFENNIVLVLDGIQDPGNMGTIIRIADWFGVTQMICSEDCADIYSIKVVQSSMGSITRVKKWIGSPVDYNYPKDYPFFGAMLSGNNIYEMKRISEGFLIIGNESKGIRDPLIKNVTHPVTIPKVGEAESLNAAVATAIILGCFCNNPLL